MVHRRPPWWFSILSLLEQSFNFQKTDLTRTYSSTIYWNSGRCKYWCILLKKTLWICFSGQLTPISRQLQPTCTENLFWCLLHHNSEVSQRNAMELAVMIFTHNIIAADICHQPFPLVHPQLLSYFRRRIRFRDTSLCGAPQRDLSFPVNHAITSFKNVRLPSNALLWPCQNFSILIWHSCNQYGESIGVPASKLHTCQQCIVYLVPHGWYHMVQNV